MSKRCATGFAAAHTHAPCFASEQTLGNWPPSSAGLRKSLVTVYGLYKWGRLLPDTGDWVWLTHQRLVKYVFENTI